MHTEQSTHRRSISRTAATRGVAGTVVPRLPARQSEAGEVKRARSVGVILETAWAADAGRIVRDG